MTSLNVQYFKPYYVVSTNSSIFGLSQWQDHEGEKNKNKLMSKIDWQKKKKFKNVILKSQEGVILLLVRQK